MSSDRPDLCARVFKLKLDALMDDLLKNMFLERLLLITTPLNGKLLFILLIMHDASKPRTP